MVIGITGRIGAGKTSAGEYLSSRYGFQYVRYSQVLSEWKDPGSKARLQEIGWEVMANGMQGELNSRLIDRIVSDTDVAVDGLRHPLDYESLKKSFKSSFHLLYLDSPQNERWKRKKVEDKYRSLAAFEAADSHPVEQQIESLRAKAALVLPNEGSLQDLYVALDKAVRGFSRTGHT
ncbi:MAG: AAA family ATPase [Terriglobia bacterium]